MNQRQCKIVDFLKEKSKQLSQVILPELIANFRTYLKTLVPFIKIYQNSILYKEFKQSNKQQVSIINQQLITIVTVIQKKLLKLKKFSHSFLQEINKYKECFTQQNNRGNQQKDINRNLIIDIKDNKIDEQVIKIINYYENNLNKFQNNSYKLLSEFSNNAILSHFEQQIRTFYQKQKQQIQKTNQPINKRVTPHQNTNSTQEIIDKVCLRCTTHFVNNDNQNFMKYPNKYNKYNTVIFPYDSFFPIDTYENLVDIDSLLTASICSMLNNQNGGLIFVGCQQIGTSIIPKGIKISQKQKQSFQQKVKGNLGKIFPKIEINKQLLIDYVPVMKIDEITGEKQAVEGYFVCRIFVQSYQPAWMYFIKCGSETLMLEIRQNGQSKTIDEKSHYKKMSQKFSQLQSPKKRTHITTNHNLIKCKSPLSGIQFYKNKDDDNHSTTCSSSQFQYSSQLNQSQQQKKYSYKYWILVVCDKKTTQQIMKVLKNKDIKIEKMFQKQNFKFVKTTWVLYHNHTFQMIQQTIKKNKILFKDKEVKLIATNLYLEILDGGETDVEELENRINQKIGQTKIQTKYKSKEVGEKNMIISFSNLKAAVYSYFYLSNANLKVKFIRGAQHFKDNGKGIKNSINNKFPDNDIISSKDTEIHGHMTDITINSANKTSFKKDNNFENNDSNNISYSINPDFQQNAKVNKTQVSPPPTDISNNYINDYNLQKTDSETTIDSDYRNYFLNWDPYYYLQYYLNIGYITYEQYARFLQLQLQPRNQQQFQNCIRFVSNTQYNTYENNNYLPNY